MNLKDITILYGNNGSGKSTVLKLIAEKIEAQRNSEIFKDVHYVMNSKLYPFDDFVKKINIKMAYGMDDKPQLMPSIRKLITSDDIFKKIDGRTRHNQRVLLEIEDSRIKQEQILKRGYTYKSSADYEDLVNYIEARKLTKKRYSELHSSKKENMRSNGETALDIFDSIFDSGGIFLLDEPENCLSPIYQIELIKIIKEMSKYYDCQFIICTHSPLLLSIKNALIYDLDARPVTTNEWSKLENVKIYYDFFMSHKKEFDN